MDRTSLPTPSAQPPARPPVGVDRGLRRALCEELVLDDPLQPRLFMGRITTADH